MRQNKSKLFDMVMYIRNQGTLGPHLVEETFREACHRRICWHNVPFGIEDATQGRRSRCFQIGCYWNLFYRFLSSGHEKPPCVPASTERRLPCLGSAAIRDGVFGNRTELRRP